MALHGNVLVPMVPSAFGFRNIRPKTRHERMGKNDKVALERERLAQRSGWQARLHQANAPPTTAGLTSCQPNDEGYMSNADRFHSDVSGEEFAMRQEALRKREAATLFRRDKMRQREEEKWKGVEDADRAGEEYWAKVREDPSLQVRRGGKKNASNVAYDITNLQYNQDTSGEMQRCGAAPLLSSRRLLCAVASLLFFPLFPPILSLLVSPLLSLLSLLTPNPYTPPPLPLLDTSTRW